jgi:virulence factor Mce-like protein
MERATRVGAISAVLLIAIGSLILWKSDVKYRASGYKLIGKFDHVAGLLRGADVRYRGYKVGRVSEINPAPETIYVEIWVKRNVDVPINSTLRIQFDGLVGENFVDIAPNINETELMEHGDIIEGKSGSDLAGFLDLGSQNLVHTEAILKSLRSFFESDETMASFKKITSSIDMITDQLSSTMKALNDPESASSLATTMRNIEAITTRLDKATMVMFENGNMAMQFTQISKDLATLSQALSGLAEGDSPGNIKQTITNLEKFSGRLNRLFPDEEGKGSNIFSTLANVKIKTEASVRYASLEENAYYDANLDFKSGRYFIKAGIGNRYGESTFQHFQQGIQFNRYVATRLGLFYKQTGVALDLFPTQRTGLSVEVYEGLIDSSDLEVDLLAKFQLRNDLDLLLGIRKNQADRQFNTVDTGVSYHF